MEPPLPTTILNPIPATTAAPAQPNYPNSSDSSPRSRNTETWDDQVQIVPVGKLRFMCSYGGHIIPRPHDKSLCYVGGDTRMVVVDRLSSLSDLASRLSRTLLHGRQFNLKYQLPNEDLDSLVSVSNDEDLENMIEEYDRTASISPLKNSRLRLFLFLARPETAASMGCLLNDAKSETWFVDALNGAGLIPRVFSDSAAIDNLLEFDDQTVNNKDNFIDPEAQNEPLGANKQIKNVQDVQSSLPDSPMLETSNSSFGSSSSSPCMSNLPPIRVRVETNEATLQVQMAGLNEQFSQMNSTNVATNVQNNQGDGVVMLLAPPPLPVVNSMTVGVENANRIVSDDERSDQGVPPSRFRKPPLPLQPVQRRVGHDACNLPSPDSVARYTGHDAYSLTSPDSVASDTSIASANSLSKNAYYQDPTHVAARETTKPPATGVVSPNIIISDPSSQIPMQQNPDQVYVPPPLQNQQQQQAPDQVYMPPPQQNQQQQQQFFHPGPQYYHQTATSAVPVSSYYPMYAPQAQQPYHQQVDQQYSMYLMPVSQTQPYNTTMHSNVTDSNSSASSYPTNPQNPAIVASTTTKPTLVQVPANQFQQQYVNLSQIPPHPSQSPVPSVNYGYEYAGPTHEQVYYTQHPNMQPPPPPQYQTMTSAAAVLLSQASAQQSTENAKQQIR